MADDTPNDSAPDAEDMQEGTQEPVSGADGVADGETPVAEAEAAQEADTAVAVAEPEPEETEPTDAEVALMAIRDAAAEVKRRRATYENAKTIAADAKKAWESAVEREQDVIDEATRDYPLFDQNRNKAKEAINAAIDAQKAEVAEKAKAGATDQWRSFPLSGTSIPSNILAILAESSIATVGDVANLSNKGLALTDVRGIGPTKASRIEDSLAQFWHEHPEFTRSAPAAADVPSEPVAQEYHAPADEFEPEGEPAPDEVDLDEDEPEDDDDSED